MHKVTTSGGLVTKKADNKTLICLVKFTKDLYSIPKGHINSNESLEQAALREVNEELGLENLLIVKKLGICTRESVEEDGTHVLKEIHVYLMNTVNYTHKTSEEKHEWVPIDIAINKMFFKEESRFLNSIINEL